METRPPGADLLPKPTPGPGSQADPLPLALGQLAAAVAALAQAAQGLADQVARLSPPPGAPGPAQAPPPAQLGPQGEPVTLAQATNEFLLAKAKAQRSDAYLRQLRHALAQFADGRGGRPLASISTGEIERHFEVIRGGARTVLGRQQYVQALFRWSARRGYIDRDPAAALERPTIPPAGPAVHSPDQVAAILGLARDRPRLRTWLALRYFAGLRGDEVGRLAPEDLNLARGWVVVPAAKAKTRRRRLVRIQPALAAWLALGVELPNGSRVDNELWELRARHPFPWPRNVTRHTWASYHLAAFGSASTTAAEAGHSETVLFGVYRELVAPDDAAAFWALRP